MLQQKVQTKQINDEVKLSPQDPYIEYAIAILPSSEGVQKITDIHKKLAEQLIPQGLEEKPNKCHVTLYHGAYKAQDLPAISAKLGDIAYNIKSLTLNFKDIVVVGPNRWIDINIKRSDENPEVEQAYKAICNLHRKVVDTFNEYHQRPLERAIVALEALKDQIAAGNENALKIAKQIQTYGVSGLYELYNPHTTMWYQWPTNPALEKAVESVKPEVNDSFSCDGWALVIGKLGFNGNIESLDAVLPLGQNLTVDQARELAGETNLDC